VTGGIGATVWLVVSVVLFVVESFTVQIICVWFAVGALAAMIAAGLGAPLWAQFLVFLVVSLVTLFPGRRLFKSKLLRKSVPTNADQVIGQLAVVESGIDNITGTGRGLANGLSWAARTADGEDVPPGSEVRVLRIEGVKLIVEPAALSTTK
jgi:membrane protein implicated in regulation of membrane protease activity